MKRSTRKLQWGNWVFDGSQKRLDHKTRYHHGIYCGRITSYEILEFIFEIDDKEWADPKTIYDLVGAFRYIVAQQKNNGIILVNDCLTKRTPDKQRWGNWRFDRNNQRFYHESFNISAQYEIHLEEITSSKNILDRIFDIHGKKTKNARIIYDLVDAFKSIVAL